MEHLPNIDDLEISDLQKNPLDFTESVDLNDNITTTTCLIAFIQNDPSELGPDLQNILR